MEARRLGRTGLEVPVVCVGTSPLGGIPEIYGYDVTVEAAVATILRALDGPLTFIDTSNGYRDAERRIGLALRERGGLPAGAVLATKVDPAPGDPDFSGQRVRASVRESLERLGVDHLQLVHLHDPERITFEEAMAPGGPVEALIALRDEGLIDHLGVAGGPVDLLHRFLATDVFDVVLSHNRFTLVDQSAGSLVEECTARGIGFVNAAPYGGGMLAQGPDVQPRYCYRPAGPATIARVRAMQRACEQAGVPLAAAALQFSVRDERIASTLVGMSSPARIDQTLELLATPIPAELWRELEVLAAPGRDGVEPA